MSIQGSRSPQDRGVTPNLMVRGVNEAIESYQRALGAELLYGGTMPNGMTLDAQLRVGTSFILLSDEIMSHEGMPTGSPLKLGGTSAILEIYVDDVDRAFDRAIRAGGKAMGLGRSIKFAQPQACLGPYGALLGVHRNGFHPGKVDHQSAIAN